MDDEERQMDKWIVEKIVKQMNSLKDGRMNGYA